MERKIGEVFEYQGKKLIVQYVPEENCKGCFFDGCCTRGAKSVTGYCDEENRTDGSFVIFTEVKDELTEQLEERPDLLAILKYCPKGTEFWSPMLGYVKFICLGESIFPVEDKNGRSWDINRDSTMTIDGITSAEPMLFPSKEQRDWSKVEYKPTIDTLPKTWEEFCKTCEVQRGEAYFDISCDIMVHDDDYGTREVNTDKNTLPSKEAAEAHLALMQLHQLRDYWRQGWKPEGGKTAYAIIKRLNGEYAVNNYDVISRFLQFQDRVRAEKFLDCFRDLIKLAGDLI